MSNNKEKRSLSYYFEKFAPGALAGICLVAFACSEYNLLTNTNFLEVLRATISVSAVLVGFMATMIAILISNISTETISYIKDNDHISLLNSYFHSALLSGFVLAIGSTICIFSKNMTGIKALVISDLWVGASSFFVFSSFRVIFIMLAILREISDEKNFGSFQPVEPDEKKAFQSKTI
ncbi:MAG: hypothetical protein ABFD08_08165 [Syntrophomonas sp.]